MVVRLMAPNGLPIIGTLDMLLARAWIYELTRNEHGGVEFFFRGQTEVIWSSQRNVSRPNAAGEQQTIYIDDNGNEWLEDQLVPVLDDVAPAEEPDSPV